MSCCSLREMRDAAVAIRDLVGGRSAEEIDADALRRSALRWHFAVLGEVASQVPVDTKHITLSSPGAPQPAYATASSPAGHWDIDVETLVATAVDDLP